MKVTHTFEVPCPLEPVASAICSEGFQLESDRAREGVVSSSYAVVERGEGLLVFEVRSVEYKRTKLGGLDRSATTTATTRFRWSAGARALEWSYHGEGGGRMKLGGSYRLAPSSAGTRVSCETTIEVDIPLLGGQIAKYISRQLEQSWPQLDALLTRHARAAGAAAP